MKRTAIDRAVVKRAAVRSSRESASLERRIVPDSYVRSEKVRSFVMAHSAQK